MVIILVQLQCTCIGFPDVDEFLKSSYCTSDARGVSDRGTSPHAWLLGAYVPRARAARRRARHAVRGQASELTRSEHLHVGHRRAQQLLVVGYCSIRDGRSMDGQRWCVLVQCVSSTVLSEQLLQLPAGRRAADSS